NRASATRTRSPTPPCRRPGIALPSRSRKSPPCTSFRPLVAPRVGAHNFSRRALRAVAIVSSAIISPASDFENTLAGLPLIVPLNAAQGFGSATAGCCHSGRELHSQPRLPVRHSDGCLDSPEGIEVFVPFHSERGHRVRKISRGMGRPNVQAVPNHPVSVRADGELSLPARFQLGILQGLLGVCRRAGDLRLK